VAILGCSCSSRRLRRALLQCGSPAAFPFPTAAPNAKRPTTNGKHPIAMLNSPHDSSSNRNPRFTAKRRRRASRVCARKGARTPGPLHHPSRTPAFFTLTPSVRAALQCATSRFGKPPRPRIWKPVLWPHNRHVLFISQKLGYLVRSGGPDAFDSIVTMAYGNLALQNFRPLGRFFRKAATVICRSPP
jgi:hypothetical protein